MKTLQTIFFVLFLCGYSCAQTDTLTVYKIREFGVNTTPFLKQFISIGNVADNKISRAFMYKRTKAGKRRALRFGFGLFFDENSFFQENQVVHLSIGSESRRKINKNWYYYFGYDGFINARPNSNGEDVFGNGIGVDAVLGIVFQMNKYLSVSTETTIAAAIGDGFSWQIAPPLALYFNFRAFKKTYF